MKPILIQVSQNLPEVFFQDLQELLLLPLQTFKKSSSKRILF